MSAESQPLNGSNDVCCQMGYDAYFEETAPGTGVAPLLRKVSPKLMDDAIFTRWDGGRDTAEGHLDWMTEHARKYCDVDCPGFEPMGIVDSVVYEMHSGLTHQGNGNGYFRLSGEVDISAELITALALDVKTLISEDKTMRYVNIFHRFGKEDKTRLSFWVAAPGLPFNRQDPINMYTLMPFAWRDGMDLTGWREDSDGTIWQVAVSVPDEVPHFFPSRGRCWRPSSVRALTNYWAYKLEPIDGGKRTKVTLICQSTLNGVLFGALVNPMVGQVLASYIRDIEKVGLNLMKENKAKDLIQHTLYSHKK
mmetsp:Transcript_17046/g.33335  ORF Transcript_17046/g.33335 Transcript_17046/m.33335 type:complete len:308 (+) Transcript_17046:88-1011(+)|eukprot:CAMPEP_0171539018 /NCGR_PEP_ID=MMETSP0960-20121227/362_1 /TAXON_ID=87120 /ORGANISM="Aurantiochytrium limacinum, Strain ATCCMYA-1381" /LENGTH=307 /DNA_ID=CAMNT_0012085969 /DNA_START=23 /DNA_END=949 /DNA_ORIENTATION=+